MSKPSNPRREADNEAKVVLRTIRVSPRKLDLVAATISGKKAASAVNERLDDGVAFVPFVRSGGLMSTSWVIDSDSHLTEPPDVWTSIA